MSARASEYPRIRGDTMHLRGRLAPPGTDVLPFLRLVITFLPLVLLTPLSSVPLAKEFDTHSPSLALVGCFCFFPYDAFST